MTSVDTSDSAGTQVILGPPHIYPSRVGSLFWFSQVGAHLISFLSIEQWDPVRLRRRVQLDAAVQTFAARQGVGI
jgi:hypothetical protein